ncbi:hypothetical protein CENSYa_1562 [Cenarchaeum symbiosum A]|uniref:Uncharacterized protein n=1 Tax=Cenarchaeum symbiosum (strain A) TaxID=414004 RepID=A0RXW5_CENSY|nr:hypothetical protein CENSYa_1562 [Cenarchaeum symbiosum A]
MYGRIPYTRPSRRCDPACRIHGCTQGQSCIPAFRRRWFIDFIRLRLSMAKPRGYKKAVPGDPTTGGPGDLRVWGLTGKESAAELRDKLMGTLDSMLADPPLMYRATSCKPGGFEHILAGFAEEVMNDQSRPIFRGGPERMELRHLLLIILLYLRGASVLGVLAVLFGVKPGDASAYLDYAMNACQRSVLTPEKFAARLMGMISDGRYDDLERAAPGLRLHVGRMEIPYRETGGRAGDLGFAAAHDAIIVCTSGALVVAMAGISPGRSPLEALAGYMSGEGSYLGKLVRPLPDGRRWTLIPDESFLGDLGSPDGGYERAYKAGDAFDLSNGMINSHMEWAVAAGEVEWPPGSR